MDKDALKYSFFTPYNRGYDLVFDFVLASEQNQVVVKPWSISASYGYEGCRELRVFADGVLVSFGYELFSRFGALIFLFRDFMHEIETRATAWQKEQKTAKEAAAEKQKAEDETFCNRILSTWRSR